MASPPPAARPWNPNFLHSDRERWICIYPAYLNSKKAISEGRKIPKDKCVDNPTHTEIKDCLVFAELTIGVENKVYPRERDPKDMRYRGRIRLQLKDDNGVPLKQQFPDRRSVLLYLGETIPKLKSRQQSSSTQSSAQQQSNPGATKKSKKNKKK